MKSLLLILILFLGSKAAFANASPSESGTSSVRIPAEHSFPIETINWKYVFGPIFIFGETIQVWMLRCLVTGSVILGTFILADYDRTGIEWHDIYWVPASIMIGSFGLMLLALILTPLIWLYRLLNELSWRRLPHRKLKTFFRKLQWKISCGK